jgi:hypothetical protein
MTWHLTSAGGTRRIRSSASSPRATNSSGPARNSARCADTFRSLNRRGIGGLPSTAACRQSLLLLAQRLGHCAHPHVTDPGARPSVSADLNDWSHNNIERNCKTVQWRQAHPRGGIQASAQPPIWFSVRVWLVLAGAADHPRQLAGYFLGVTLLPVVTSGCWRYTVAGISVATRLPANELGFWSGPERTLPTPL